MEIQTALTRVHTDNEQLVSDTVMTTTDLSCVCVCVCVCLRAWWWVWGRRTATLETRHRAKEESSPWNIPSNTESSPTGTTWRRFYSNTNKNTSCVAVVVVVTLCSDRSDMAPLLLQWAASGSRGTSHPADWSSSQPQSQQGEDDTGTTAILHSRAVYRQESGDTIGIMIQGSRYNIFNILQYHKHGNVMYFFLFRKTKC